MDGLQELLFTLRQNKLRTALTAFGVFWGIFMLILLLGAGNGMKKAFVQGRFNDVEDSMWIFSSATSVPYKGYSPGRNIRLTEDDMKALREQLPDVGYVSSENPLGTFTNSDIMITYGKKTGAFGVLGVEDEYFNIKERVEFKNGRRLNYFDKSDNRKVVVIGTRVAEQLFAAGEDPIGKDVKINDVLFRVVGVFYDKGNRGRMSERLYMPRSAFKQIYGSGQQVSLIALRPKPGVDGIALEAKVKKLLQERHQVAPDDENAIMVNNYARFVGSIKETFKGITAFIWLVGIGTLLAGIVGVSNIMIITVKERTREIGIRKALGARPSKIVNGLLVESVLVTSISGYFGLTLGVVVLEIISALLKKFNLELSYFQQPEIDLGIAFLALLLLIIAGVIAGLVPALQASRIMPIEAMKAE